MANLALNLDKYEIVVSWIGQFIWLVDNSLPIQFGKWLRAVWSPRDKKVKPFHSSAISSKTTWKIIIVRLVAKREIIHKYVKYSKPYVRSKKNMSRDLIHLHKQFDFDWIDIRCVVTLQTTLNPFVDLMKLTFHKDGSIQIAKFVHNLLFIHGVVLFCCLDRRFDFLSPCLSSIRCSFHRIW